MLNVKITPGPWTRAGVFVNPLPKNYPVEVEGDDGFHSVAQCFGSNAQVNALAIAAIPDLLDVVLTLCNQLAASGVEPVQDSNDPLEMLHFKALAAIAKVKGESEAK